MNTNIKYGTEYNIYYGTIGKTLGVKYRITKLFRNRNQAINYAKECAASFYYKHEGTYGIPSFDNIIKESELTGIDVQTLYDEHITDFMRCYVIPTDVDSIPSKELKR